MSKKDKNKHAQMGGGRLQKAQELLRKGNFDQSIEQARKAIETAHDVPTRQAAGNVLVEALFRNAANNADPAIRLKQLDEALKFAPLQARLHYHRGATLWRLGRWKEANAAFTHTLKLDPKRSGVNFLMQLTSLLDKQPTIDTGLAPAEQNALKLVAGLINDTKSASKIDASKIDALATWASQTPLPGASSPAWGALLQMLDQPKAAPVEILQQAAQAATQDTVHQPASNKPVQPPATNHILTYYTGIAAMRKGDKAAAFTAWRTIPPNLFRPAWLMQNQVGVTRQRIVELVRAGEWEKTEEYLDDAIIASGDAPLVEAASAVCFQMGSRAAEAGKWEEAVQHWRKAYQWNVNRQLAQNLALAEERAGQTLAAADAWREMIRRRPRKSDHPDSLSDDQVAAIWQHVADSYAKEDQPEEAITCLKNAIKYAENDLELRINLVDAYQATERVDAAENELDRILAINGDYVPALMRLGAIYSEHYERDPIPVWQKVLKLEPQNEEARTALAQAYIELADEELGGGMFSFLGGQRRKNKDRKAILEKGLKEVPGQPLLLRELGMLMVSQKKYADARNYLRQAWQAAPNDLNIVGSTMHELLHAEGDEIVKELLPSVRSIDHLLAQFWISQADSVLECKLNDGWANRFWEEAIALGELRRGNNTKAYILTLICETAVEKGRSDLAAPYEARLRSEFPHSGGLELLEARRLFDREHEQAAQKSSKNRPPVQPNLSKVRNLLKQAKQKAQSAKENGLVEHIEAIDALLSGRSNPLFNMLGGMFGGGPGESRGGRGGGPGIEDFLDFLNDLDEEDLRELSRRR